MKTRYLVASVALVALISAFLNPDLSFSAEGLAIYLGFLAAIAVVLITFELPGLIVHRRRTGEAGRLRVLPWAIVLSAVFVLVSRMLELQPGYLYGVILGVLFLQAAGPAQEGREAAANAALTLVLAVGAWLTLGWVRSAGLPLTDLAALAVETALAAIVVAALEAVAFGLMPFRFMPGVAIYRWNRLIWGALFFASLFAFFHILIGPTSGYLADLTGPAWFAALGIFAAFGAFTVLFWAWFRFRPAPAGN